MRPLKPIDPGAGRVLIRGCGDVGSAVAHALRLRGTAVILHDTDRPAHTRRAMAFTDALYEGLAELDHLLAKRMNLVEGLSPMLACGRAVPVTSLPLDVVWAAVHPNVVVDARMRKRDTPENQRAPGVLAIGLGPNFVAGGNVDLAIETAWGEELGRIVRRGPTVTLGGEPRQLAGVGRERYVYAPIAGTFVTAVEIGQPVTVRQVVAHIGQEPIAAPLAGWIRGLCHNGAAIREGLKVLEVQPSASAARIAGIGGRPRRIAEGVVEAIALSREFLAAHPY